MTFVFQSGRKRRVMHIMRFTPTGIGTFEALCGISLSFNRSCNLPLGRKTCKRCRRLAA